jgi:hypothetical protein
VDWKSWHGIALEVMASGISDTSALNLIIRMEEWGGGLNASRTPYLLDQDSAMESITGDMTP